VKYYLIAGEASGDLHGSNLIKELKKQDPKAEFRVWGGDLMEQEGAVLVKHFKEHAIMGFIPVIMNIRTIKKNFKLAKKDIVEYQPDLVIFIDYSGFNLRVAEQIKPHGFKTFYYISPQVWAWRQHRVKKIKRLIDQMYVVLPFEKDFYKSWDYDVEYYGHPVLDAVRYKSAKLVSHEEFMEKYKLNDKPVIAILPGSRKQEVKTMLPVMLEMVELYPEYQFVIAGAPSLDPEFYKKYILGKKVQLIFDETYQILKGADAALVTSGTATLETALLEIPQVVCYKTGQLTYQIVKNLVNIKFISLVNLIMDRLVVRELIQNDFSKKILSEELNAILNTSKRESMLNDYKLLIQKLGDKNVSERVGKAIYQKLKSLAD